MTTNVTVVGTIATVPKLINPGNGTKLCTFRLASDERRYNPETRSWSEGTTNWFGVACFRVLAEHAHLSFNKGDRIIVQGKLRSRDWEKGERRGTSHEIDADAIGHDLRWGISKFEKRITGTTEREPLSGQTTETSETAFPEPTEPADQRYETPEQEVPDYEAAELAAA